MRIAIGTTNEGKILAVQNCLARYPEYEHVLAESCVVESGVAAQPKSLEEIILGAKNRAQGAMQAVGADFGVGLETGIFTVPAGRESYFETTACAIFDGADFYVGLSSSFEYPQQLTQKLLQEGKEVAVAAVELGYAADESFRKDLGMIGFLTQGVVTRIHYSEQAVHMALVRLRNKGLYTE